MKNYTRIQYAIPRNLQNYEDPHTNLAGNVMKSSNLWRTTYETESYSIKSWSPWRSTQETGTLFYKIFKHMTIYIRTRHAILQNLQTYEGIHESGTLFYKIYKPTKKDTRIRQADSAISSNPWWSTHEPSKLLYEINYIILLNFKLMLVKINNTIFSKFNVLTTILQKILTSYLIHSVICLSAGP
jgi:hypothetical protein